MPLDCEHPPVRALRFETFDDPIGRGRGDPQAGGDVSNALVMERVHGYARCTDGRGDERSVIDRDFMNSGGPIASGVVLECAGNLARNILYQSASKRDVEKLRSAADREHGLPHSASRADESDLREITRGVGDSTIRGPVLSVECRVYIFAASEKQPIDAGQDGVGGILACEWRDDEWYDPCTLQCGDVGAVEPDPMRIPAGNVGCRRDGDDGRSWGANGS